MTRVLLVRHGRTRWNVERRVQGRLGEGLDEVGRAQAAELADRLVAEAPVAIVASSAQRAHETATIVALRLGLPVALDDDLVERGFGILEGRRFADLAAELPDELARLEAGLDVTGAEPYDAVTARMGAALRRVAVTYGTAAGPVVVVSHGAAIRHGLRAVASAQDHDQDLPNCHVLELDLDPETGLERRADGTFSS